MPIPSKFFLRTLTRPEKARLKERLADRRMTARVRERYHIIQTVSGGASPTEVGRLLDCERRTVYHWVAEFNENGFSRFERANNPAGRPPVMTADRIAALMELARSDPRAFGLPFQMWSVAKLRDYAYRMGIIPPVTQEWVRRLLMRRGVRLDTEECPWWRSRGPAVSPASWRGKDARTPASDNVNAKTRNG
jgi:transposase